MYASAAVFIGKKGDQKKVVISEGALATFSSAEPENDGFQKESPFPGTLDFRFHVKFQGCIMDGNSDAG